MASTLLFLHRYKFYTRKEFAKKRTAEWRVVNGRRRDGRMQRGKALQSTEEDKYGKIYQTSLVQNWEQKRLNEWKHTRTEHSDL